MEYLIDFIKLILAPVLSAVVAYLVARLKQSKVDKDEAIKEQERVEKEQTESFNLIKNGLMLMLRKIIRDCYEKYVAENFCSENDLEELEAIHTCYKSLGGNGSGDRMMLEIRNLPHIKK